MRRACVSFLLCATSILACGDGTPPPKHVERPSAVVTDAPRPKQRASGAGHSTAMTYEEALEVPEDIMALKGEHELSNADLAKPLRTPAFLDQCGAPESMKVTVKVAVRDGRAMGVSVFTSPDDATVAECIDRAVRELTWPMSKRRDTLTTLY